LIHEPSLNVRGLRSAYVGAAAQTWVPEKAEASIDARLVKGEDPRKKYEQIVAFIRKQGFYVIDHEPTMKSVANTRKSPRSWTKADIALRVRRWTCRSPKR